MKEIDDILRAYELALTNGQRTALATVVHVEGSSYRRAGARMLVTEEGHITGAISGGCLEGDALRKALLVMTANKAMLVTYDTNDEDDAKLGMGLGCNGIIQVLIEPIDFSKRNNPLALLKAVMAKRQKAVIVTLFSLEDRKTVQPGTCLLLKEDEIINEAGEWQEPLIEEAKKVYENESSSFKNYTNGANNITAFTEILKPVISLVVAGAGNDAMPLVNIAHELGWQTTLVDGRANYATATRFPLAQRIIIAKPAEAVKQLSIDNRTVFALLTHNYVYDLEMIKALLPNELVYIGLLGPKKKRDRLLQELSNSGDCLAAEQLAAIHGPAGLDIGAETPEEIAISIIAEIQAVLAGRQGQRLKEKTDAIHSREATIIDEVRVETKKE